MRPASPAPSASGSINNFIFDSNASLTSNASRIRPSNPNFWDYEAYSRSFLHEKKSIEKEKEEWERNVRERSEILNISAENHLKKLSRLKENVSACLQRAESLDTQLVASKAAEIELEAALKTVKTTKKLLDYFENLKKILTEASEAKDEEFNDLLIRQNWKAGLDSLVALIDTEATEDSSKFDYLRELTTNLIEKRKFAFHQALEKKTRTYIDGLGWPKIVSNEETAEIISRLQELLTYGEAIYILSKESIRSGAGNDGQCFEHPISQFYEPIKVRFDYHFSSDRPTNQINRPEWYFEHLLTTCRETMGILREFLLPCWRLRDLDDYLRDGIVELAAGKTESNLVKIREEKLPRGLFIHHLIETGKFLGQLKVEFGFLGAEGVIERVFVKADEERFVEEELERIKGEYEEVFDSEKEEKDHWSPDKKNPHEPSPLVLKFLSFFHQQTILPYSFLRSSVKLRAKLLVKVQSWCLETFHDRCLFDCPPLHSSEENIMKDIGMINSFEVLCRVLRDDFGESLDYLELSSESDLHEIIGYDPSGLPGTCFNRASEAFRAISEKLSAHLFNFVMERFLKTASQHANAMIYARPEDPGMNENFRLAVAILISSLKFIQPLLCDREYRRLFNKLLPEKLAAFLFAGLLTKNFFSEAGAERFARDLKYLQETLLSEGNLIEEVSLKMALAPVFEAAEILKIKEKDPTAQFDGSRLAKVVKGGRPEDLKRILDLLRCNHLKPEDLSQIFASRRHI